MSGVSLERFIILMIAAMIHLRYNRFGRFGLVFRGGEKYIFEFESPRVFYRVRICSGLCPDLGMT